jgi:hypothetical protein
LWIEDLEEFERFIEYEVVEEDEDDDDTLFDDNDLNDWKYDDCGF